MEAKRVDVEQAEAGERLRKKREAAQISVPMMAVLLDCTVRTVENYERGDTKASGAVVFAYDNIDRLLTSRLGKRTSTCDVFTRSFEPRLFDPDEPSFVIDLREHILNQTDQNDSQDLYANAG